MTDSGLGARLEHLLQSLLAPVVGWRTNGVSTNGALQKSSILTDLGKKVRPGTFGKTKVGQWGYPKSPSVEKHMFLLQ